MNSWKWKAVVNMHAIRTGQHHFDPISMLRSFFKLFSFYLSVFERFFFLDVEEMRISQRHGCEKQHWTEGQYDLVTNHYTNEKIKSLK